MDEKPEVPMTTRRSTKHARADNMSASSVEAAWLIGYVGASQSKQFFGDIASELASIEEGIARLDQRVRDILYHETGDLDSVDDLARQVYRNLNVALKRSRLADFEAFTVELAHTVGVEWARRQRGIAKDVESSAAAVAGELHGESQQRVLPAVARGILDVWYRAVRSSNKRPHASPSPRSKRS
jgi:hypothetical protein